MKSPFSLKRYFISSGVIAALFAAVFVPVGLMSDRDLPLPFFVVVPLLAGLGISFSVWFVGDVVFRGVRKAGAGQQPRKKAIVRIVVGAILLLVPQHAEELLWRIPLIGDFLWEFEDLFVQISHIAGWVLILYGAGQLGGIMKTRHEGQNNEVENIRR